MKLDIISFYDLNASHTETIHTLKNALFQKGIIGVRDVPEFEKKSRAYIRAARSFSALPDFIKKNYSPNRDSGQTEGYELGAEWFKNKDGIWQIDDKKASYYAFVPDNFKNKWPTEIDLKTSYLALGELIYHTGKMLLNIIGLNHSIGLNHHNLVGYGRMLHYHQENNTVNENHEWCGAHVDHGLFTGLIPAYYFRDGIEMNEPDDAGLYIVPSNGHQFEKINCSDKEVLLFQVGEFGQLISNDRIKATKHMVRKASGQIERFTFALFYNADHHTIIKSNSELTQDARYQLNQFADGSISYENWQKASLDRYRAIR